MLNRLLTYLRPIWEGNDKKPSIRRLMAIFFAIGVMRMIELSYSKTCELNNEALYTLCGTLVLLLGLTTTQNIFNKNANSETGQTHTTENQSPTS